MNYFDLHCDTPFKCYKENLSFKDPSLAVSESKGKFFDKWYQTFAIWINENEEKPYELYINALADFKEKLKDAPSNLTPIFSVEGGALIENDIERLFRLKSDGIRFLTLTWNGENTIAGGQKTEKGLTDFGKEVIKEMNTLKIGCDLSHINEKSFYSAIEIADFPLATHSNCRTLLDHPRNLTDEQIKLIAEKGGIIGLCYYPAFLGGKPFDALYKNICHLLDMGLENNIALGSDFDGAVMDETLSSLLDIPVFYNFLSKKGLKDKLLDKIFFQNANNYIAKL